MISTNRGMPLSFLRSSHAWLIVWCGMFFYCFNYFLRISPSVMQNELTSAFHMTATQFGTLTCLYYWAYTPMQIPAGMIYDKFGVRFVLCAACLMASIGLGIFVSADSFLTAGIGRFIIGLGCAFAYIGTLKLASLWLPANRFATVAGIATAIGMVSGTLTQTYLTRFVEVIGYKAALQPAMFVGVGLSIMMLLILRNRPKSLSASEVLQEPLNLNQLMNALYTIFTNRQMWLIGMIGCLLYLPSSVFLDVWGVPYLEAVYGITKEQAVASSSYTFYGWIIAGPILGALSDKIKRRVLPLTITGFFAAVLLSVVFYMPGLISLSSLSLIFFSIGFCCGAHSLCFALGKENNPLQISGTAVAVTNMLIMAGGAIFQPVVGMLLDFHTSSPIGANGLPVYSASDYTFALSIIPIGVAIGLILALFVKETYCESKADEASERIFRSGDLVVETEAAK